MKDGLIIEEAGLDCVPEAFADRGYRTDGSLVPRDQPGALIEDPHEVDESGRRTLLVEAARRPVTGFSPPFARVAAIIARSRAVTRIEHWAK